MSVGYLTKTPNENQDGRKVPIEEPVICVLNKQRKPGVLKFIGETKFSSGVWCGIALREACGKNDGSVAGVRYFECDEQHGIFVNPKNVFPIDIDSDERNSHQVADEVSSEKSSANQQRTSGSSFEEGRPRSKSDAVINEKNDDSSVFSSSPFHCNIGNARSSSLSKLNNVTYICSSPGRDNTDSKCELRHPSQFLSSDEITHEVGDDKNHGMTPNVSSTLNYHTELSPKLEVKQSITLESINTARFPAPAGLGKNQDANLNKTFLVRSENRGVERENEEVHRTWELSTESNERSSNNNDNQKPENIASLVNQENSNAVHSIGINESDIEKGRQRSGSKSSWSSMESLSSVGSVKSNKGRSRLNGTKTPRKLPCPTECSKLRLVKISAERKQTQKGVDREAETREKIVSRSVSKPANDVPAKKSRTKSTSVVAPRSTLTTPLLSKSAVKTKSKSVSSDLTVPQSLGKSRLNASKFATPLASKISAPPSSRLTSTPICKKPPGPEMKSKLGSASSRTSSVSTLSRKVENEQSSISRENSNVENKQPSLPVRNKSSSIISAKKEKENKSDVSRSRNLSTSTASNKSLSAKSRTLSTSAALKPEQRAVAARGRNLSTSCATKEQIKPPLSKLRNMSTSRAQGGITKASGSKSSLKSPSVGSVSEKVSTSSKTLSQPRKVKTGETFSFKERQNSEESVKKKTVKEKPETTNTALRSCLNSAATPDILKQTPEIARHSVAVQVDTSQHEFEETTQMSTEKERKADALFAAVIQRNREFEACLVALQVYAEKVDHERENASLLRKNLKFTKERCHSTENLLVKESSQRARLEEEMLSAKSDSVVEVALLRAEYERKQEIIQAKLKEAHKKDVDRVRKQHVKSMEDMKHSCDLKLKRIEETYVEDIGKINEKHKDVVAELESQHSKHVDDLVEERHAEIETIKADYDEQLEQIQETLSKSEKTCNELGEKLRTTEEEAKRDVELRIQDAIAQYKSLPNELESMKYVLEMKNTELKKFRKSNAELQHKIDELQQIKERAALLEREKESLNFVVENKSHFERQLSLERDKLRLSLDREVATSKRLSLENEELAWRLNSFQNSPTSPTIGTDRFNWRMSGFNSPDSAVYSQKIEESDFEYQMNDTKEIES